MSEHHSTSPSSVLLSDATDNISMRDKALLKRSVSKHHNNNFKAGYVPVHEQHLSNTGLRGRKTFVFWALVFLIFILAAGNLFLTMLILGVLRLGNGMESLELVPQESTINFFGAVDLGSVYKHDGLLEGFEDDPIEIIGDNGSVFFNVPEKPTRPIRMRVDKNGTFLKNIEDFDVRDRQGNGVLSLTVPHFRNLKNVSALTSKTVEANRISSPINSDLLINSNSIHLKGAEGTGMEGSQISVAAHHNLVLRSENGSVVFEGRDGIYLDSTKVKQSVTDYNGIGTAQYKVCVCMPQGKLFKVPVPISADARVHCNQINMSQQHNPCM